MQNHLLTIVIVCKFVYRYCSSVWDNFHRPRMHCFRLSIKIETDIPHIWSSCTHYSPYYSQTDSPLSVWVWVWLKGTMTSFYSATNINPGRMCHNKLSNPVWIVMSETQVQTNKLDYIMFKKLTAQCIVSMRAAPERWMCADGLNIKYASFCSLLTC